MFKTFRSMANGIVAHRRRKASERLVQRLDPRLRRDIGLDSFD